MTAPYRQKLAPGSNVPGDVRVGGMFTVSNSTGAPGSTVRPSAGMTATAGQGNLFTVTQPTSGTFLWLVTLAETYYQPVWTCADMTLVPTAANAGTSSAAPTAPTGHIVITSNNHPVSIACTALDHTQNTGGTTASNSFYIYLFDTVATTGVIPTSALTLPSGYNLMINFEVCSKNTTVPNSL